MFSNSGQFPVQIFLSNCFYARCWRPLMVPYLKKYIYIIRSALNFHSTQSGSSKLLNIEKTKKNVTNRLITNEKFSLIIYRKETAEFFFPLSFLPLCLGHTQPRVWHSQRGVQLLNLFWHHPGLRWSHGLCVRWQRAPSVWCHPSARKIFLRCPASCILSRD